MGYQVPGQELKALSGAFLFHRSDHRVHSLSWSVGQGENSVHPVLGELGTRVQIYGINSNRVEFITNYVQAPARQA